MHVSTTASWYLISLVGITRCSWKSAIHSPYAKIQIPKVFHTLHMCYTSKICSVEKTEQHGTTCSLYEWHGSLQMSILRSCVVVSELPTQALKPHQGETKSTCFCSIFLAKNTPEDIHNHTSVLWVFCLFFFISVLLSRVITGMMGNSIF